jgi:outer membrane protein assembly factor BamB
MNPFSKDDTKNAPAVLQEFAQTMKVKPVWTISVGKSGSYFFSPVKMGNDIYAASADGTMVRLNSATGQVQWKVEAGMPLTAGVGANAATLAVAGKKGMLLAFDLDGKLRWKVQASSEILTAPVIGQGLVIVRSMDNRIAAYDVQTGERKWAVNRVLPPLILRTDSGIALTDQTAIVALPGGKIIALSLANGALRWEASVAEPKGATELERIADVSGTPAIFDNMVCTAAYQGRVSCFDLISGAGRWSKNLSSEVGVSVDERFVFAADTLGGVSAFARMTGSSMWRNDKLTHRNLSAPTSYGRAVAVGDMFGYLHLLSREDGSFIGRVSTDGSQILAAPIVAGSNLIVQTKSGTVVAFATE